MTKILLFFTALLFTMSANAASINVTPTVTSPYTITNNGTNNVFVAAKYSAFVGAFLLTTGVTSDVDALVKFDFLFSDLPANPGTVTFSQPISGMITPVESFAITSPNLSFIRMLFAGQTAFINPMAGAAGSFNLNISGPPSAVPVPAALLLFAPALMGFLGLRRKVGKNANGMIAA